MTESKKHNIDELEPLNWMEIWYHIILKRDAINEEP